MPIDLYTGQPGNGKTVQLMRRLLKEAESAQRPLFAAGIDGLRPGLATVLKDPREWNAVKPGETCTCHDTESADACDAHVIPNGSLIFVDEAWKWFGHLQDATRQATPPHVLQLAEHRHRGLDFVWTTQMPNQLFPFVRGLVGTHTHVVRRFGTSMVELFQWGELQEDVKSAGKRELAQRTTTTLDAKVFDSYKSAEVHTIKRRIPLRVLALPAILVAALAAGYFAVQALQPDAMTERITGQKASAAGTDAPPTAGDAPANAPLYTNAAEYVKAFTPRIPAIPWTAPAYDRRQVASDPTAACVLAGAGLDAAGDWIQESCRCVTEQGTRYEISDVQCRAVVHAGGVYNPFKAPVQAFGERGAGGTPADEGGTPAPVGASR